MPNKTRLWTLINGEYWLSDGESSDVAWKGHWFFPRVVESDGVHLCNPPMPLNLDSLRKLAKRGGCVSTEDVSKVAKCSRLTILRHVAAGRLKPTVGSKVTNQKKKMRSGYGKKFLFRADEVLRWMSSNTIKVGRPKKASLKR